MNDEIQYHRGQNPRNHFRRKKNVETDVFFVLLLVAVFPSLSLSLTVTEELLAISTVHDDDDWGGADFRLGWEGW
jgi:hypothetical protein